MTSPFLLLGSCVLTLQASSAFAFQPSPVHLQLRARDDGCALHRSTGGFPSSPIHTKHVAVTQLGAANDADNEVSAPSQAGNDGSIAAALSIATIAILYWVYLVFGAAVAQSNVLPVPGFIPLVPGWPPSDADLRPALEDSAHFFYIRDLLDAFSGGGDSGAAGRPPLVRLAVFNFAEAWVFAFLPVLLADGKRLPLPVTLFAWAGALGLTNAFLAPYLALREGLVAASGDREYDKEGGRNAILSIAVGAIATGVSFYAVLACLSGASSGDWSDFATLATEDRTYLAFCVDLILFSIFQPFLLGKVHEQATDEEMPTIYRVPFVGLMAWLFAGTRK